MNPYTIIMIIFGIMIILVGFSFYRGKKELLPYTYHGKRTKSYLKYLGKVTMVVGIVPIISGGVASFPGLGDTIIPVIVLILGIIIAFIVSIRIFHEE